MQEFRLANGGKINRSQEISFCFDGKRYEGYAGDTLASALLANGVSVVGRSFKFHRPRGIVGSGSEEPNAIVQVGVGASTQPNLRATQLELYDGLVATSTKGWPSVRFDVGAVNSVFSKMFGAGFYYKTFMRPKRLWKYYEHFIRASAGFGRAPLESDPDQYEHMNAHCDVLVAGGGPAGIVAALTAAKSGARVIIADENADLGGSLLGTSQHINGASAHEWIDASLSELTSIDRVTILPRSTVFGYYDHNFLAIAERCADHVPDADRDGPRQRLWRVRAKQVVLAQGAFERPLVFCNNDRPGVMTASAVSTYIHRYGVCPGRRAVVFANNDSAYRTAIDLHAAGAPVVVVDSRQEGGGSLADEVRAMGMAVLQGHVVCDVVGRSKVKAAMVAQWNGDPDQTVESSIRIDCDLIAMSGGWSPAVHLHSQSGGRNRWDDDLACFVPGEYVQEAVSAGSCNGKWSLEDCFVDAQAAADIALERCGFKPQAVELPNIESESVAPMAPLWRVPATTDPDRCPTQFVDYQNDTSVADIRLATREGYRNVEHVKRYTALGFGTDQGKLGNINGMAIVAECLGEAIPAVGTTTFRPAYTPVTFGVGAGENVGELFDPVRTTAIHMAHVEAGAPMEVVGQWHRPRYFPRPGEDLNAAVARECLAVRNSLGIMDASTLGKIDARGPDVVTFLERIYTHNVGKVKAGRCAYGIMLGEDGMVMDDGVMACVADGRYYLTTTTGGAAKVMSWLEFWLQTEWPELDVYLTSLTDQYSTIAVAGPKSRALLQKIGCNSELDNENFPFMSVKDCELDGLPVQLFRVSFSGELAFEINIDSDYALAMWQALTDVGKEFDITPYGTETMHVLRAEKGFVIVGQDTDGSVTPVDLRMNWMLSKDKDYLGKRSLSRPDCVRKDRKQFVGLLSEDGCTVLPEGAQLVNDPKAPVPVPMCGYVTSSYDSAFLGRPIALALVEGGHSRTGEKVYASLSNGSFVPVKITSPVFFDPKAERQNG